MPWAQPITVAAMPVAGAALRSHTRRDDHRDGSRPRWRRIVVLTPSELVSVGSVCLAYCTMSCLRGANLRSDPDVASSALVTTPESTSASPILPDGTKASTRLLKLFPFVVGQVGQRAAIANCGAAAVSLPDGDQQRVVLIV